MQSMVDMMFIVFHCPQRVLNRTSTFSLTVTTLSLPLSIHPLLRSCHRRPRHSTLVVSTTVGGLQGNCHGISGATRTCAALSESTSSDLWTTWSLPSSFIIFTATARASIPAYNRQSTFLSSRLVTPMEFAAIWYSVISIPTCFSSSPKTFLFRQSFPDIALWRYYTSVVFVIVLLFKSH